MIKQTSTISHSWRQLYPSSYFSTSAQFSWLRMAVLLHYRELAHMPLRHHTPRKAGTGSRGHKAPQRAIFTLSSATPHWSSSQFEAAITCQLAESDMQGGGRHHLVQPAFGRHAGAGTPGLYHWSRAWLRQGHPWSSPPYPRQGQWHQAAGPCPVRRYLPGWRSTAFMGDLHPCLTTHTVKKAFSCAQM